MSDPIVADLYVPLSSLTRDRIMRLTDQLKALGFRNRPDDTDLYARTPALWMTTGSTSTAFASRRPQMRCCPQTTAARSISG